MEQIKPIETQRMLLIQEEPLGPTYMIEIKVENGQTEVTLPIIQQLVSSTTQRVVVKGLRLITVGEQPIAPVNGQANAPLSELLKMTITLYAEGWEKGYRRPLLAFNTTYIEGSGIPWRDKTTKLNNWSNVEWNKSKILFANGTPAVGNYTVLMEAEYERFDINGKIIIGPSK